MADRARLCSREGRSPDWVATTPAKAGVQSRPARYWTPAFVGVVIKSKPA